MVSKSSSVRQSGLHAVEKGLTPSSVHYYKLQGTQLCRTRERRGGGGGGATPIEIEQASPRVKEQKSDPIADFILSV